MSDSRSDKPDSEPDGDEERGRPKDDRAKTEAVLEDGMPPEDQRKPRTGPDAEGSEVRD